MKIAILGGTFNPVHNGHLNIAKNAIKNLKCDEVWFLINNNPPNKDNILIIDKRIEMLKLAINYQKKYKVSYEEAYSNSTNYSYDTVSLLIKKYPMHQFSFLIGSDQLANLHNWKNIDKLSQMVDFYVVNRIGNVIDKTSNYKKYKVNVLSINPINISSEKIRSGDFNHVPLKVKKYIEKNYLYLDERIKKYLSKNRYDHIIRVADITKELSVINNIDVKTSVTAAKTIV